MKNALDFRDLKISTCPAFKTTFQDIRKSGLDCDM